MAKSPNILSSDQASANGINSAFGGNRYFTAENQESNFLGVCNTPYTLLRPVGTGVVDVYNDMYWSNLGSKKEVPQIYVIEKQLKYGAWATQLSNLLTQGTSVIEGLATAAGNAAFGGNASSKQVDSFLKLYNAEPTGFSYTFPWLLKNGDGIRSIDNQWSNIAGLGDMLGATQSTKTNNSNLVGQIIGAGVGAALGAVTPGFGFEDTKAYAGTNQQSLTITFPLYNTIDLESSFNHFSFVNLFSFQNLKTRTSLMSFIPPKIYDVDAYSIGGIYMAAAFVSNFKVDSIGTTRRMTDWKSYGAREILIPEAYRITITFTDLMSQSSNIFSGALGGRKIRVTTDESLADAVVTGAKKVMTGLGEGAKAITGQ